MGKKKVDDEAIVSAYAQLGSVWKAAKAVNLCGQTVHERLVRIGKIKPANVFTEDEREMLRKEYTEHRNKGKLDSLAQKMGRTKPFLCRQARAMGLTNAKGFKPYAEKAGANPYAKFHARVRSLRGAPRKCEICGEDNPSKYYDWANITGDYENPDDYKRMCRPCHRKHDKSRPMLAHLSGAAS